MTQIGEIHQAGAANATALQFAQLPRSGVLPTGVNHSLRVVPQGVGPFTYEWTHNGTPLTWAVTDTLTFFHTFAQLSGTYEVTVTDALNRSVTVSAYILISDAPITMSNGMGADGKPVMHIMGLQGVPVERIPEMIEVQATADFQSWIQIQTEYESSVTVRCRDPRCHLYPLRYYRIAVHRP